MVLIIRTLPLFQRFTKNSFWQNNSSFATFLSWNTSSAITPIVIQDCYTNNRVIKKLETYIVKDDRFLELNKFRLTKWKLV